MCYSELVLRSRPHYLLALTTTLVLAICALSSTNTTSSANTLANSSPSAQQATSNTYSFPVELIKPNNLKYPAPYLHGIKASVNWQFGGTVIDSQKFAALTCHITTVLTATTQTNTQALQAQSLIGKYKVVHSGNR